MWVSDSLAGDTLASPGPTRLLPASGRGRVTAEALLLWSVFACSALSQKPLYPPRMPTSPARACVCVCGRVCAYVCMLHVCAGMCAGTCVHVLRVRVRAMGEGAP